MSSNSSDFCTVASSCNGLEGDTSIDGNDYTKPIYSILEVKDCIEFIKQAPRKKLSQVEEVEPEVISTEVSEEEEDSEKEVPYFGKILPLCATFDLPIEDIDGLCFTESLLISKKTEDFTSVTGKSGQRSEW